MWSNESVITLIELYRQNQCLWNKKNINYKNKNKKVHAWNAISQKMQIKRNLIETKMHNIRSQLNRELRKMHRSRVNGQEDVFVSSWFAFKHLGFLMKSADIEQSLHGADNESVDAIRTDSIIKEEERDVNISGQDDALSNWTFEADGRNSPQQRSPNYTKNEKDNKPTQCTSAESNKEHCRIKDDCSIYVDYVATELRQIKDKQVLAGVKNQINNIIYHAQMKCWDKVRRDKNTQTTSTYSTIEIEVEEGDESDDITNVPSP